MLTLNVPYWLPPGSTIFEFHVKGKSAHAGPAKHLGINPIDCAYDLLRELHRLDKKRMKVRYPAFEKYFKYASQINIGVFKSGEWPSTVPGNAILEGQINWIPGEKMENIKKEVEDAVSRAAGKNAWMRMNPPTVEWFGWNAEPCVVEEKEAIVQVLQKAYQDVTGKTLDFTGCPAASDARFYANQGKMPFILFGPTGDCHCANEYVLVEALISCIQIVATFVSMWCECL